MLLQIYFLQQCFLFFIVVVILGHNLGNRQVSVYRTIGPTLVLSSRDIPQNVTIQSRIRHTFVSQWMQLIAPAYLSVMSSLKLRHAFAIYSDFYFRIKICDIFMLKTYTLVYKMCF